MTNNRPTRKQQPGPCPIPDSTFAFASVLQTTANNVFTRANPLFTSASNVFALVTQLTWMQLSGSVTRANKSFTRAKNVFARVCPTNLFAVICRRSRRYHSPQVLRNQLQLLFRARIFYPGGQFICRPPITCRCR